MVSLHMLAACLGPINRLAANATTHPPGEHEIKQTHHHKTQRNPSDPDRVTEEQQDSGHHTGRKHDHGDDGKNCRNSNPNWLWVKNAPNVSTGMRGFTGI